MHNKLSVSGGNHTFRLEVKLPNKTAAVSYAFAPPITAS